jgi:hypothetical protein
MCGADIPARDLGLISTAFYRPRESVVILQKERQSSDAMRMSTSARMMALQPIVPSRPKPRHTDMPN